MSKLFHQTPALGLMVNYVMQDGDYTKEGAYAGGKPPVAGMNPAPRFRPAIIVETWGNEVKDDPAQRLMNLTVFVDGMNDGYPSNTLWKTSVPQDQDGKTPGTWHWPER